MSPGPRVSPSPRETTSASGSTGHGAAVTACFLGWTLDSFDYFLVVFCLTAIAKDFHKSDAEIALSITITLASRPIGALIFGLLADRYGRRLPLMLDLVFYSMAQMATGFAQNYATFLVVRALFGAGMGGMWGVSASLAMEKVPPRLRGVVSGLLQQGYAAGNLLAAAAYYELFERWGWRPLFLLGGLPALLAVFVLFRVKESEIWRKSRAESWSKLGRSIVSNWKLFAYIAALITALSLSSHGTQDMYPTFLQRAWGFDPAQRSLVTGFSAIGAIVGGTLMGLYSDRFGRRRTMIVSLVLGIAVVPLWAYSPSIPLLYAGAFLMQFMVQGAWGVIPAHLSELSPDSVRGFLPGFAYQCGSLLASSVAWIEAIYAQRTSYATAMAFTAVTVFSFACIITAMGRERLGRTFGSPLRES
jgi:MFS transporter, SHS family, lactate transporter